MCFDCSKWCGFLSLDSCSCFTTDVIIIKAFSGLMKLFRLLTVQHYRKQSALEIQRWFSWCFSAETTSKPPLLWEECLSCWQRSERSGLIDPAAVLSISTRNFEIYHDKLSLLLFSVLPCHPQSPDFYMEMKWEFTSWSKFSC